MRIRRFGKRTGKIAGALACAVVFAFSTQARGQMADKAELREINTREGVSVPPVIKPFSLLDLSRVRWSHSYSLSYASGQSGSGSFGMYTTRAFYEFSPKLSLELALGVGHNPGALFTQNQNANATFFPGFSLDYHPSDKFNLNITMQRVPYGFGFGSGFYNGYYNGYYGGYSGGGLVGSPYRYGVYSGR